MANQTQTVGVPAPLNILPSAEVIATGSPITLSRDQTHEQKVASLEAIKTGTFTTLDQNKESVPVELLWVTLQRNRKQGFFIKFIIYTIFVALFTVIMQMLRPVRATFTVQDSILQSTVRAPFPEASWPKTFDDIASDVDWWQWVETVLVPSIMSDTYFNGDPRSTNWGSRFMNTVAMYNTQTAPIRFRQARVTDDSCDTPADASTLSRPCWGGFTASRQFKEAFGESYGNQFLTDLNDIHGKDGFGIDYGREAHVVDIPLDRTQVLSTLAQMKSGLWLNEQTRAVSIETNWYNANLDLSTYFMWHIDISPGGRFQPYVVVHSCRLSPYSTTADYCRAGFEVAFVLLVVCFCVYGIYDFRCAVDKMAYLMSPWNWLEIFNMLCFVVIIVLWAVYMAKDKKPYEILSTSTYAKRPDLSGLATLFEYGSNFGVFNLVFSFLKIFRYAQCFPSLSLVCRALELSVVDMAPFLFIFFLFTCGFTFAGHWIFGYTMMEFRNWGQSFITLARSFMGGLPYEAMTEISPVSAAFFTFVWVLMMCMVMASMFVAILTQWYLQAHEEQSSEEIKLKKKIGSHALDSLFSVGFRRLRCFLCQGVPKNQVEKAAFDCAVQDVQQSLKKADFRDIEWVRKALATNSQVAVADLTGHFRGEDAKSYDFVQKVRGLSDAEVQFKESCLVRKFRDASDREGEEQERLQQLQATVGRLEADLRHLRGALQDSYVARTAPGQSLEGYHIDNSHRTQAQPELLLPGAVPDRKSVV